MPALNFKQGDYYGYVGETRPSILFEGMGYEVRFVANMIVFNAPMIAEVGYVIFSEEGGVIWSSMPLSEAEERAADLVAMGFRKTNTSGKA